VDVRAHNSDLKTHWHSLEDAIKFFWERIIRDDVESLRNFYLSLYNDVTDMVNHPQKADVFRTLFLHPKMLGAGADSLRPTSTQTPSREGGGTGSGGSANAVGSPLRRLYAARSSEFYAPLNADLPLTNRELKMSNVSEEIERFIRMTDVDGLLADRLSKLSSAYNVLADNLAQFKVQCLVNHELFRCRLYFIHF